MLAGNHDTSGIYLDEIRKEPSWGGNRKNLTDPFGYGEYRIRVRDEATGDLIYSRGFCTLFEEWQTVEEAGTIDKAFNQTVRFPFPLAPVTVEISERDEKNVFVPKITLSVDPSDPYIMEGLVAPFPYRMILENGPPENCVDIAFIAEGYTASETEKFYRDAGRFADSLLAVSPFRAYRDRFNVYAVAAVSEDSGTDLPGEGIWKNTALNSGFYTFRLERYLTAEDPKPVRDAAANVPYDQIVVLVNTDRYGGGGIYNHYSVISSDNPDSPTVLIHEFGHAFAGLADEYYSSGVTYQEFFNLDLEPWQPNITTLVDFGSKWKDMLDGDVPVPTPATEEYRGRTGVFEGAGYSEKGIYRPALDCRMKSNSADGFCEVCRDAITRMIKYYTE